MDNPYDVISWSRLHREDALAETRKRRSLEPARTGGRARSTTNGAIGSARGALSTLRTAGVGAGRKARA